MKAASSAQKSHHNGNKSTRDEAAGSGGAAFVPPAYGIDVLDQNKLDGQLSVQPVHQRMAAAQGANTPVIQRQKAEEGAWEVASKFWGEKKRAAYKAIIAGLRGQQSAAVSKLRGMTSNLSPVLQVIANGLIDSFEQITDLLISLVLAIIGLVVGFTSGMVAAVWGLIKLIWGLLEWIALAILSFFSERHREELNERANAFLNMLKNFVPNLVKVVENWRDRFEKSNPDEQTLMIGELTGEIESMIATAAAGGQIASQAPKLTVKLAPALELVPSAGPSLGGGASAITLNVAGPSAAGTMAMMTAASVEQKAQQAQTEEKAASSKPKRAPDHELRDFEDMLKKEQGAKGPVEAEGELTKLQRHKDAPRNRALEGKTGDQAQSAHNLPSSVGKNVAGYSREEALTVGLERSKHYAMDKFWKDAFIAMRQQGATEATAQTVYDTIANAIRQAPLPNSQKNSLILRLQDEMFVELALKPGDKLPLPYPNIPAK